MGKRSSQRDSQEVLEDHIRLREKGDGVREAARLLAAAVDHDSYRFRALTIGDRMGYVGWSARGADAVIRDGVDSYLVEEER